MNISKYLIKKTMMLLLVSIFALTPWYYTYSGEPQPVDVVILILIFFIFVLRIPWLKFIAKNSSIFRIFIALEIYSLCILLLNYDINADDVTIKLAIQNIYYILLLSMYVIMLSYLFRNNNFISFYQVTLRLFSISLIAPLISLLNLHSFTTRISLTFNNPNQLGFFVLVNLSCFIYLTLFAKEHEIKINKTLSLLFININLLFLFLSASRSCAPVILLYIISNWLIINMNFQGYNLKLFLLIGGIAVLSLTLMIGYEFYSHMIMTRATDTNYSAISTDIYFRTTRGITDDLSSWLSLLIGTGKYGTATRGRLEFHNNFLALLNQVGLLGLLLYIYMNLVIFLKLLKKGLVYLIPYLVYLFYSYFQYSYRTRINWLFLAFIIFVILKDKIQEMENSREYINRYYYL